MLPHLQSTVLVPRENPAKFSASEKRLAQFLVDYNGPGPIRVHRVMVDLGLTQIKFDRLVAGLSSKLGLKDDLTDRLTGIACEAIRQHLVKL